MADNLQQVTNHLASVPFQNLIGAPLEAVINAQARSALTTVEFIKSICLDKDDNIRNVHFYYEDKTGNRFKISVPLLMLIPIPYIKIEELIYQFKANIKAEITENTETSTSQSGGFGVGTEIGGAIGPVKASVNFSANYSSKKDSKATNDSKYSVEYTMDLTCKANQSDMPAGMSKVLNIFAENINTTQSDRITIKVTDNNNPPNEIKEMDSNSKPTELKITVTLDKNLTEKTTFILSLQKESLLASQINSIDGIKTNNNIEFTINNFNQIDLTNLNELVITVCSVDHRYYGTKILPIKKWS